MPRVGMCFGLVGIPLKLTGATGPPLRPLALA
jgi:hypothetical protein